jgi:hypothetical protein
LPKKPQTLPVALSQEEVCRFFEHIPNLKHRAIVMTAYATGLRVSEVTTLENGKVTFRRKDYQAGNKQKRMTLDAEEFIRRFLLHVLPAGFVRIRHYGWLANAQCCQKLALCRELLDVERPEKKQKASAENGGDVGKKLTPASFMICPACGQGRMVVIEIIDPTGSLGEPMPAIDSS